MIPAAFITHWRDEAPWFREAQIEQDLVLSRALVEIFNSETGSKLALRGGTAIYKLFVSEPVRYSEDIDLVQISPEPIGSIFDGIKKKQKTTRKHGWFVGGGSADRRVIVTKCPLA